ncbi:acyl carrier protein [Anoxybacillus vitaminiphilus]|uniref:Acyl carrier protein n=1 Tax=Paranoxybacillus vitaminiphilus TaxID=581036 RepID=A0A327YUV5_9BACL|nr:phosphopantetheine-binding protein [Anoxybacillus vitaminiphilus]RAK23525.1 acyl carrier protein [Anoxybacillus vitaminiphilus]
MTLEEFKEFIAKVGKVPLEMIHEDASFRDDLNIDSLHMVNLLIELNNRIPFDFAVVQDAEVLQTVGSLYRALKGVKANV